MAENIYDDITDINELKDKQRKLLEELSTLEREFQMLKDNLYVEKFQLLNSRIAEFKAETAPELIELRKEIEKFKLENVQSQNYRRKFRINSVWNEYLSEIYSLEASSSVEKSKVKEKLSEELKSRLKQIDFELKSANDNSNYLHAPMLLDERCNRRYQPISPTEPYIVYNLDADKINQDLAAINKIHSPSVNSNLSPLSSQFNT